MKTKKTFNSLNNYWIFLIAILILIMPACNKDNDLKPAPDLPPQGSMVMSFSDFTDIDTTAAYKSTEAYENWGWSALNVAVWNVAINVTLAVPVVAFYESFKHEGVYNVSAEEWVWTYNFFAVGQVHQASLHASLVPEGVHWEMYISKNNAYGNYLWYQGTTNQQNSTAEWHLNENPSSPNELLLIEYQKDDQTNIEDIKYTLVKTESPGYGGYIQYGINTTSEFDAFYTIYLTEQDNTINIEWSRDMKDGRVRDMQHFDDFDWKCWETNLQNMICP